MSRFNSRSSFFGSFGCVCLAFALLHGPAIIYAQVSGLRAIAEEMKQAKKRSKNATPSLPASTTPHSYTPDMRPPSGISRIRNPFDDANDSAMTPSGALDGMASLQDIEAARHAEMTIPRLAREQRSDARIHDVCFVNPHIGWAVGDRGSIWSTLDGGANWTLQNSQIDCSLRSVSFADPYRGMAVGGSFVPFTNRSEGVILVTFDGGETWDRQPSPLMPMLHKVKMESRARAWIAGEVSPLSPAGLFHTSDTGRTWVPLPNFQSDGWTDFRFIDPQTGAGITSGGEVRFLHGTAHRTTFPVLGIPLLDATRIAAIELFPALDGAMPNGWCVGKQGTVCSTRDLGRTWQNTPVNIGAEFDFQAVFARENNVWIAGKPGTMIFHSGDTGRTWNAAATGATVPIHAIRFCDPMNGYAVGDLGTIIATKDGGATWNVQRQGGTRLAILGLFSKAEEIPLELFAHYSSEMGYLGGVEILSASNASSEFENRLHEAVSQSGGSCASILWGFSLAPDEQKLSLNRLVQNFDRDTTPGDGLMRFRRQLIRSIRTWKPSVVVVPDSRTKIPVHQFLARELSEAIPAAADPNVFPEQIREAGLTPWKVARLQMVSRDIQGEVNHFCDDYADRVGRSLEDITFSARGLIQTLPEDWYSQIGLQQITSDHQGNIGTKTDMFAGITIAPGNEARRVPLENLAEFAEQGRNLARRRSQIMELGAKLMMEQPRNEYFENRSPLDTLAVIGELLGEFNVQVRVGILLELGLRAQQKHHGNIAESVYTMMVEQFPQHPYSETALRWLIHYNASREVFWNAQRKIELAAQENRPGTPSESAILADRQRRESLRRESVKHYAQLLKAYHPEAFVSPQVTFALAASLEEQGQFLEAEKTLTGFQESSQNKIWKYRAQFNADRLRAMRLQTAVSPLELLSRSREQMKDGTDFLVVKRAKNYPHLDGLFDEELDRQAWTDSTLISFTPTPSADGVTLASAQMAKPMPLNANLWNEKSLNTMNRNNAPISFGTQAMFMHDDEFLYIALRCRKNETFTYRPIDRAPRPRDPDLSDEDRVEIRLDTDRDFETCYKLVIDHRGWVGDECWKNRSWNPAWFVAREEEEHYWMIEAAIPWEQLTNVRPGPGTLWGIGLRRIVPGAGVESWNADEIGTIFFD